LYADEPDHEHHVTDQLPVAKDSGRNLTELAGREESNSLSVFVDELPWTVDTTHPESGGRHLVAERVISNGVIGSEH